MGRPFGGQYCVIMSKKRRHDNQYNYIRHIDAEHNGNQHNDIQHNDNQQNDTQHNDTQHNDTQHNYCIEGTEMRQRSCKVRRLLFLKRY
jgi:hypothetical protein